MLLAEIASLDKIFKDCIGILIHSKSDFALPKRLQSTALEDMGEVVPRENQRSELVAQGIKIPRSASVLNTTNGEIGEAEHHNLRERKSQSRKKTSRIDDIFKVIV